MESFNTNSNSRIESFPLKRSEGFALVLAIYATSFLLLIVLSLSTIVKIEINAAHTGQFIEKAQMNTLTGLNIAIGSLQQLAGPDKRATFKSDSIVEGEPYLEQEWTGIWNTHTRETNWLVSGNGKPAKPLVSPQKLKSNVTVNKVPIIKNDITHGGYAYWVSDEAIKTTVSLVNEIQFAIDEDLHLFDSHTNTDLHQLQALTPSPPNLSHYFPSLENDASKSHLIRKIQSLEQLQFIIPDNDPEIFNQLSDSLTHCAYSLLTNQSEGGFKQDLSNGEIENQLILSDNPQVNFLNLYRSDFSKIRSDLNHKDFTDEDFLALTKVSKSHNIIPPPQAFFKLADINHLKLNNSPLFSAAPVLTDFYILFTAEHRNDELLIRYGLFTQLWNPYTTTMIYPAEEYIDNNNNSIFDEGDLFELKNDKNNNSFHNSGLELAILGLPKINIIYSDLGNMSEKTVDLQKLFQTKSAKENPLALKLNWEKNKSKEKIWLPGRFYSWVAPDNHQRKYRHSRKHIAEFNLKSLTKYQWEEKTGINAPIKPKHLWGISCNHPTVLKIKLRLSDSIDPVTFKVVDRGKTLVEFRNYTYSAFDLSPRKKINESIKFGFRFKLQESGDVAINDPSKKSTWIKQSDPRNPLPKCGNTQAYFNPYGPSPSAYTQTSPGTDTSYLFHPNTASAKSISEDIPLFEIPQFESFSLAPLQHLQVFNAAPFSIGNSHQQYNATSNPYDDLSLSKMPNGRSLNSIIDKYYSSGINREKPFQQTIASTTIFTNPRFKYIHPYNKTKSFLEFSNPKTNIAENILVKGAFNINSTNKETWKAILSSANHPSWSYINHYKSNGLIQPNQPFKMTLNTSKNRDNDNNLIYRFAHTSNATYQLDSHNIPNLSTNPITHYFQRGRKALTDLEVDQLSSNIVSLIRERFNHPTYNRPFSTLKEFLEPLELKGSTNKSLLDLAIEQTPSINEYSDDFDTYPIWENTSDFTTQADLLNNLSPIITTRADTFKIRAYGEALNPISGEIEASSYCEAIVQRLPQKVSNNIPIELGDPEKNTISGQFNEPYVDLNNNNSWDPEERYTDQDKSNTYTIGEPFSDKNNDGIHNAEEPYQDLDLNNAFTHDTNLNIHGRRFKIISFKWLSPQNL